MAAGHIASNCDDPPLVFKVGVGCCVMELSRCNVSGVDGSSLSDEGLWIVCPSYNDVTSYEMLRSQILEVVDATPLLRRLDLRFVLIDDTAGYDEQIDDLKGLSDVSVITPPLISGISERSSTASASYFRAYVTPISL